MADQAHHLSTTPRLAASTASRRGFLLAAGASTLLTACGSGTIESALVPARIISFGDGMSDVGQSGNRYTINDASVNIWAAQMAYNYGVTLTPNSKGGWGYAQGNARIVNNPDAAGNATTLSVKQQIDKFLASNAFGPNDLVLVSGGTSDVIAEMAAVTAGTQTAAQMADKVGAAGQALAAQLQRLVQAGAKYVVVAGVYNVGRSPWATAIGQTSALSTASAKFNEQLLVNIVNLGANVLYADAAYYYNLVISVPTAYNLLDSTSVMCTSVDAANGLGIGAGQVSSYLCTANTIATGKDYTKYVFADPVYFTPAAQALFGNFAYTRLKARW